jgi:hypothetical protein
MLGRSHRLLQLTHRGKNRLPQRLVRHETGLGAAELSSKLDWEL